MAVWFRSSARRLVVFVCILSLVAGWSPVMAGTTGALIGTITDTTSGAPLAGAKVTLTSPSQVASTQTDAKGNFVFASMAPDTYTITIAKDGYDTNSTSGISILADQTLRLPFKLQHSLKNIANVTSRSSMNLVRSGTTTDVYSVSPAVTKAAAPIGGGGGLNNAYSAIAAMPGAFVPNGQMGVNQTVYIRGGYYDQIGYEYDGVPVNRAFDNYPAHSASTLGQQELQIYAGGGGANSNATGLAGFINQVTKTGTFPGYGTGVLGIGAPTFYHQAEFEAGGATPDRLFSYYVGISGADQDYRYLDNDNGSDLVNIFPYNVGPSNRTTYTDFYPAMYPNCSAVNAKYKNPVKNIVTQDPGCYSTFYNVAYSNPSYIADREAVANIHIGIPHKNDAGKDDVQLLYTNSSEFRQYYSSVDDAGLPLTEGLVQQGRLDPPHWPDYYTYPGGTPFLAPAQSTKKIAYLFPGSPTNRCANIAAIPGASCAPGQEVPLPDDYRDGRWDTASIVKLQYQKNFGSNAYLRVFGYTFYSNTNRSGATRRGIGSGYGAQNFDYEVDGHTRGLQADFADQINSTNQINASVNYVKSGAYRINNYNYDNGPYQQVSNLTDGTDCYNAFGGKGVAGFRGPCNSIQTQGTFLYPTAGRPEDPCSLANFAGSPACATGATFRLTYTGNQALVNAVTPAFTNVALGDEWRPNDKLDINVALKYANDNFYLQNTNDPGKNFWFAAAQQEFCYNPQTDQPVLVPQPPQDASTVEPYVSFTCPIDKSSGKPVQTVHPDGKDGHLFLSNTYPLTYVQNYWQPRIGMTFTANPDTVFRISAGRYAQEPQNYEIQYNSLEENLASELIGFLPYGFTTPFHNAQAQFSDNYDFSYERHFKGTDMSIKITPYYRYATQQLDENIYIPTLLASPALNAGTESSSGVELEFTKGDFNKNGLAAVFSYTYLNSVEKWNNFQGITQNAVDPYNQYIQAYNALTKAGGGSKCYKPSADATPAPACGPTSILNPYYNSAPQPLLDKNAWYVTGLDYPYTSPNVFSLILNYKHNRFAVTPAFTLNEGATYGSSADVIGIDPRTCSANQGSIGLPGGVPRNADYTSCGFAATPTGNLYIPNPQTGTFDSFGQFRQPWQFNMGLSLHYDISPRVSATAIVANLVNACFGGSATPWSAANPPSQYVCGYSPNPFYIANFYNGTSPNDRTANGVPLNPYFAQSFAPSYGDNNSYNYPLPLNVYITVQVKL